MTTEKHILDSQQVAPPLPDNIGISQPSGLDHHAVFNRQRVEQDVASTESARQHKDATNLICQPDTEQRQLVRRLTPLECERLQGFPDGWTDIPGASDSARYKALGNSVAIPCVTFVLRGIAAVLRETVSG